MRERERQRVHRELDNRSERSCGDIVLKFCASNKVISLKLSIFIVRYAADKYSPNTCVCIVRSV